MVIECQTESSDLSESTDWVSANREALISDAQTHGAVLFRGFPMRDPSDFDPFISAFALENFPYEQSLSNAVRINFTPRVFSANEAPSDVTIFLHHEMAQTPLFPGMLFFCCQRAADEGGATPLCRSDVLLEQMNHRCPEFVRDCESKGLKYSNVMPRLIAGSQLPKEEGKRNCLRVWTRSWQSLMMISNSLRAAMRGVSFWPMSWLSASTR